MLNILNSRIEQLIYVLENIVDFLIKDNEYTVECCKFYF